MRPQTTVLRKINQVEADLGNAVSLAIVTAVNSGETKLDMVLSIVLTVVADCARTELGNDYLRELAHVLTDRANDPLPRKPS